MASKKKVIKMKCSDDILGEHEFIANPKMMDKKDKANLREVTMHLLGCGATTLDDEEASENLIVR